MPTLVSETDLFAVQVSHPDWLFIAPSQTPPAMLKPVNPPKTDKAGRVAYTYRHAFHADDNDCLQFAESLAKEKPHYREETCVFKVQGSRSARKLFGDSDELNIALAVQHRKDHHADPAVGDAYAVVRTDFMEQEEELNPYHIAFVIAEDGRSRITLEADAGVARLAPVFDIYSTIFNSGKTFHGRYKDMYGGRHAATIVLKKTSPS